MQPTYADELIYLREMVHNLTGCAEDTLSANTDDWELTERIGEILRDLRENVDSRLVTMRLLEDRNLTAPTGEAYTTTPAQRVYYSTGIPVYTDDDVCLWLNKPEKLAPRPGRGLHVVPEVS